MQESLIRDSRTRGVHPRTYVQVQKDEPRKGDALGDMSLALSVVFCVMELAVRLLWIETCPQVLALIFAVTACAASAISIECFGLVEPRRFKWLCICALLSNLLLSLSGGYVNVARFQHIHSRLPRKICFGDAHPASECRRPSQRDRRRESADTACVSSAGLTRAVSASERWTLSP